MPRGVYERKPRGNKPAKAEKAPGKKRGPKPKATAAKQSKRRGRPPKIVLLPKAVQGNATAIELSVQDQFSIVRDNLATLYQVRASAKASSPNEATVTIDNELASHLQLLTTLREQHFGNLTLEDGSTGGDNGARVAPAPLPPRPNLQVPPLPHQSA